MISGEDGAAFRLATAGGGLFLLCASIVVSLSIISMVVLVCADCDDNESVHSKGKHGGKDNAGGGNDGGGGDSGGGGDDGGGGDGAHHHHAHHAHHHHAHHTHHGHHGGHVHHGHC